MITPWNKQQKVESPVDIYVKRPSSYVKPYFKQQSSTSASKFNVPFKAKPYLDEINENNDLGEGYRSTNKATQSVIDNNAGWVAQHPHAYDEAMQEDREKDEDQDNQNAPFKLNSSNDNYLGKSMKQNKQDIVDLLGDFGVNKSTASISGDVGVFARADEDINAQKFADKYEQVRDTYDKMYSQYQSALKQSNGQQSQNLLEIRKRLNQYRSFLDNDTNKKEYAQSLHKINNSSQDYLTSALDRASMSPNGDFDPASAYMQSQAMQKADESNAIDKIGRNNLSKMTPQQQQQAITKQKRSDFINQQLTIQKNAQEDYDKHIQDLKWWQDKYKISKEFSDKKQQYANASIFNPHYWQYEVVGTMGSSYADAKAQLAATGLGAAGMVLPMISKGPVGWAAAAALGAGEYFAKRHSSEQENNAEVGDRQSQSILNYLQDAGVKDKIMPELRKAELQYKKSLGFSNDELAKLTDDDAIKDAYMNRIDNRSSILKTAFTKSLPGNNEQFNRDMATTAFSDLLETSIDQVGLPIGKLVKTIGGKVLKPVTNIVGKALDNTTIGDMSLRDAIGQSVKNSAVLNAARRVGSELKEGAVLGGQVANATSTGFAGHAVFDTTGALFNAAGKELYRALPEVAQNFARRSKLALDAYWQPVVDAILPKTMAAKTAGNFAYGIAKNTMVNMLNEGAEEGKQYINSLANSKDYYMGQESSLYSDLWKDFENGMAVNKALLSTIGLASSPYENDEQFWQNWKGGAVLGGLHTSAMAIATHTYPIIKQMQADNVIGSNIAADRMDKQTSLLRGKIYAQAANTGSGYGAIANSLDHLRSIKEGAGMQFGDDYWNSEKQLAQSVYRLQTNKTWRSLMAAKGVDVGSDEFNTLTSLHANTQNEQAEILKERQPINQQISQILNSNGLVEDAHNALIDQQEILNKINGLNVGESEETDEEKPISNLSVEELDAQGKTASYISTVSLMSRLRALLSIDDKLNTVDQYKQQFKQTYGTDVVAHDAKNISRYIQKSINETATALKKNGITLDGSNQNMKQQLQEQSVNPAVEAKLEKLYQNSELLNSYNDVLQNRMNELTNDVKYDKNTGKYTFNGTDKSKAKSHILYQKINNVSVDNDMFYKQANDILTGTQNDDNQSIQFEDPIEKLNQTKEGKDMLDKINDDKYLKNNPYLYHWLTYDNQGYVGPTGGNTNVVKQNSRVQTLKNRISNHIAKIVAIRSKHRGEATAGLNLNNLETLLPIANLIKDSAKLGFYSFKDFVNDVYTKHQQTKLDADDMAHLMNIYTVQKNSLSDSEKLNMQDDLSLMQESVVDVLNKLGIQDSDGQTQTTESVKAKSDISDQIDNISNTINDKLSSYNTLVMKDGTTYRHIDAIKYDKESQRHVKSSVDTILSSQMSEQEKIDKLTELGCDNVKEVLNSNIDKKADVLYGSAMEKRANEFAMLGKVVRDTMQHIITNGVTPAAEEVVSGINNTTESLLNRLRTSGFTVLPVNYRCFGNGIYADIDFVAIDNNGNVHLIDVVTKHTQNNEDVADSQKYSYYSRMDKLLKIAQQQLGPSVIAMETVPVKVSYDMNTASMKIINAKVDKLLNTIAVTTEKEVKQNDYDNRIDALNDNIDYLNAQGRNLLRINTTTLSKEDPSSNIARAAQVETAIDLTQNEIDNLEAIKDEINNMSNTYVRTQSGHPGVTEETDVHNISRDYIYGELQRAASEPDFITNSKFELDKLGQGNRPMLKITYKGKTYDRLPLDLFKEDRVFLDKIRRVVDFCDKNKNYESVVIGPKRTNGIIQDGPETSISEKSDWFDSKNAHLTLGDNSNSANDSKLGFVKLKYDADGKPLYATIVGKGNIPLYTFKGDLDDSIKIPGSMVYLMKKQNLEDSDGVQRYIPVAVHTDKFTDDQYDVLVNYMVQLCKNGKAAVDNNGILIYDILPMFMQFSNSMFYMNDAKYDGVRDRVGYLTNDGQIRFGTKTYRLVDYNGNVNQDAGDGTTALKQDLMDKLTYINSDRDLLSKSISGNDNKLFEQIKKATAKVGDVQIFPGYTFNASDFTNGRTLLNWMVNNDKLHTNFEGLTNPRVSISDVKIQQKMDTPKSDIEQVNEQIQQNNQKSTQELIDSLFYKFHDGDLLKTNREEIGEYFKQQFGDDFAFDIDNNDVLAHLTDGDILGRTTTDGITIANTAVPGIQYHEAFHRVLELLEDKDNRKAIYKRYKSIHGNNLSDRDVAEGLADMYMEYRLSKDFMNGLITDKSLFTFKKLFNSIYNFGRFSMLYFSNRRLQKVFLNMDMSKYNGNKPTKESKDSFRKRFGNGLNFQIRNNRTDDKFESSAFTSNEEVNEMAQGLAVLCNMIHNQLDRQTNRVTPLVISSDTPNILFNSEIGKQIKASLIHGNPGQSQRNIKCFDEIFSSKESVDSKGNKVTIYPAWNAIQDKVNNYLSTYLGKGHNEITDSFDTDIEDAQSDNTENGNIGQYTRNSYEYSQLSRANEKVKNFFGTVLYKNKTVGADGNIKISADLTQNMFNLPTYVPLSECFNKVLNDLHGVKDLDDLYNQMKNLSDQGDLIYMSLFDKFNKLYKSYKDSFETGNIDYDSESQLVSIYTAVKTQKLNFTFVYSRSNGDGSYLEIRNTDFDRDSVFHAQRWVNNLLTGQNGVFYPVRASNGNLYFNGGKDTITPVIKQFRDIIRSIGNSTNVASSVDIDGKKYELANATQLSEFKRKLVDMFNVFGIDLSTDFLNYQLTRYYGSSDASAIFKWLTSSDNKDNFNAFLNRIQQAIVNKNGLLTNSDGYVKSNIGNAGFLSTLSQRYAEFLRSKETLSATLAGNNKGYLITLNNTLSDTVDLLNGDTNNKVIQNLLGDNYNITQDENGNQIGSLILKSIQNDDRPQLSVLTPAGFKTEKQNDSGVKYSQIPEYEDYVSKMEYLANSNIIFPTLSDKTTYGTISGIRLPGINLTDDQTKLSREIVNIIYKNGDRTKGHYAIFPDDILDQMVEYVKCERASIVKCMKDIGMIDGESTISEEQKVVNFHTKNKQGVDPNGTRFASLFEVYDGNGKAISINDPNKSSIDCLKAADELFFNQPIEVQRTTINNALNERLLEEIEYCEKIGLIHRTNIVDNGNVITPASDNKSFSNVENIGLNNKNIKRIYDAYIQKYSPKMKTAFSEAQIRMINNQSVVAYIADTMAKSIISLQEAERVFAANPQFCKWKYKDGKLVDRTSDEIKRLGGLMSTGTNNLYGLANMSDDYTCAEIKDVEVGSTSNIASDLHNMFLISKVKDKLLNIALSKNLSKDELTKVTKEIYDTDDIDKLKEMLGNDALYENVAKMANSESSAYTSGINVADGASYITSNMAAKLLRQLGLYDVDMDKAFQILTSNDTKYTYKQNIDAWKHVANTILGTQKYSAYGHRYQNGVNIPYYNKTALFPIFPSIAYGRTYDLQQKMEQEGVDMVMMNSAVKVGSQGAIGYDELGNKPFNIYNQDFLAIRKQLNTDPNDKNNLVMGTQALKVGLSNLRISRTYQSIDGKEYSGEQLRDGIMGAINNIAAIGRKRVLGKFMLEDGGLDLNKFSSYVKDQLDGREADKNLLDALTVVNGDFSMPIEATSSLNWIQSILVSEINKNVIDAFSPGHAFYQRSVLGVEGMPQLISEEEAKSRGLVINNGKKLQMINSKDHSMDCVLSIDYWESMIPKKKTVKTVTSTEKSVVNGKTVYKQVSKQVTEKSDRTFDEARQWLIDNKIIGEDAIGNLMTYRIPTQAQSSIHAMRCVDVIPAVKDTIILPEEFTKITGSDFDIDKLFVNRLSYNIDKDGNANFDFEDDSLERYQNQMLNGFLTLLKDSDNSISTLFRSIDNDTDLITSITDKIPTDDDKYEKSYKFYTLSKQCKLKTDLSTGKSGIGPYALNNNSSILTQLYNVQFNSDKDYNAMLVALGATSLGKYEDRDGNSIASWIGAFINAHVDMAKDPYISKVNVNPYTYNMSNLLIRTGFGKQGVCFLCSPIIKAMAKGFINGSGMYLNEDKNSIYSVQQEQIKFEILNYLYGLDKSQIDSESGKIVQKQLSNVLEHYLGITDIERYAYSIPSEELINAFQKCINNSTFEKLAYMTQSELADKNKQIKVGDTSYSIKDIQEIAMCSFLGMSKSAEDLSNLVKYCKIDTKKQGKSLLQQLEYVTGYNDLKSSGSFINMEDLANKTYIDYKTKASFDTLYEIERDAIMSATPSFLEMYNMLKDVLGIKKPLNESMSRSFENSILTSVKSKFFSQDFVNKENERREAERPNAMQLDIQGMFYGEHNMAKRLNGIKLYINNNAEANDRLGKNELLRNLIIDDIKNKKQTFIYPAFIRMLSGSNGSKLAMDNIIQAWDELLSDPNPDVRNFASDLAVYSFFTSGDNVGYTKFFNYVPNSWRISSGYADYMKNVMTSMKNGSYTNYDTSDIMINNWFDNNYVKHVKVGDEKAKYSRIDQGHVKLNKVEENQNFVPVIIANEKYTNDISKIGLYRLTNTEEGIYSRVTPQSAKFVGGYQLYENGWRILPIENVDAIYDFESNNAMWEDTTEPKISENENDINVESSKTSLENDEDQMEKEGEDIKNYCKGGK